MQRPDGRLLLCACLDWEQFDEEDDLQRAILLDYLYDSLMFTVDKGMAWPHVCHLFDMAKQLQDESIGKKSYSCDELQFYLYSCQFLLTCMKFKIREHALEQKYT